MPFTDFDDQDTIVAISTPPGRGGIGILRLSGAQSKSIVEELVTLKRPLAAGRARFGKILDPVSGEVLDEAVVTYFASPHSYTGEDVAEIALHGSPALLEHVVQACCAKGARLAEPGEFTQRAFLSGRIDLTQAEAVDDLIQSQTIEQARAAARQLGGALSRAVASGKENLVKLIAGLEAGIDFAEDDIDVLPAEQIRAQLVEIVAPLEQLAQSFRYGQVLREGFSLAIVGRPNAGKSSLFNRLIQRERAIVTATAGTTRDLVKERMSLDGIPVELIDTAGLRSAAELDEAERLGITKSHEAIADADVVLLVVDATVGEGSLETELAQQLEGRPFITVYNKADLAAAEQGTGLRTSALSGEGVPELRRAMVELVSQGGVAASSALLTNLRQYMSVIAATNALKKGANTVIQAIPHEMLLLDLYEALQSLDQLTGATTNDDILHLIFSKFCIGK